MKKHLLPFFFLIFGFSIAQKSGNLSLIWSENQKVSYGEYFYTIPNFDVNNFNFNEAKKTILFVSKFLVDAEIDESNLQISNVVYEPIAENLLGELDKSKISNFLNAKISNSIAREEIRAVLTFNPIIKDDNGYKKVISLSYNFDVATASNRIASTSAQPAAIINSVLSSGTFKRFYVQKSGVYKITKSFLDQIGFSTSGVNPQKIKIYGNGGRMVPLSNAIPYPLDLTENSIQVIGDADGVFNDSDYILFYAEGVDNWSSENKTHLNLYEDKSYYYVTTDGANGKRIPTQNPINQPSTLNLSIYDDYYFHEVDLTNIGKLGRVWFGEPFNINNEQTFDFSIPNINTSFPTQCSIHYGSSAFAVTTFKTVVNGVDLGNVNMNQVVLNSGVEAAENFVNTNLASTANFSVKITYNNNGLPTAKAYLDYIILKSKSNLTGFGKQYRFRYSNSVSQNGVVQFDFINAANIGQIWDITDIYNVEKVPYAASSSFSFKGNLGERREYIAIDEADFYAPLKETNTSVPNQNLKGAIFKNASGNFQDIDYLILTPRFLESAANRLANFHRTNSGMNVKVVDLDLIYNEFGGGKQDIGALRNFVKYVYQNASAPNRKIKYLNLFGDASFDFKDRTPNNTNIVPIYHATNSYFAGEISFASDDFFCLMDANEGDVENDNAFASNYGIDIAVGRMLVSSVKQADEMVNKVIEYYDIKSYGNWRNNYVSISDDPSLFQPADKYLQFFQNRLTDVIYQQKPFINYKKILLDAYQQQTSAGGDRYPQARTDLRNAFEKGALVFNYLGHGGEDGLTEERIWEKFDGANFNNQYRYPLFITITCDFSKFDNPLRPTAGEYTYWNPKGGAISMITTTRTIGQNSAQNFNDVLGAQLFAYGSNAYPTIAEALRISKNASNNNSATRVVFYLGDPALKLAIPQPNVVLTKVNDVPISQPVDDLKALSYVKLSGEVRDENDTFLSNYNGELFVTVFDKSFVRNTLRNDFADALVSVAGNIETNAPTMPFNSLGETIFRGNASVNNGIFEFGFVVPKDIKINVGNGRVSFYTKRNEILLDKSGFNMAIKVGGINLNAVADVTPPKIRLYMNDETFVNGGITNASPYFLAFLEDEHGINTASGIGHDIVGILDGDETKPYIMNDYYETELNNYQKGKIRYPFRNLAKGLHTIKFKAWDVYNNFVTAEIQFLVVGDDNLTLSNVLNYPNPFVNYTQFWFSHNKPFEPLEVQVLIMTITGKVVKSINEIVTNTGFLSREITWDGRDDFGDKIGKGVYIYKLTVKSTLSDQKSEKIEKLVIL